VSRVAVMSCPPALWGAVDEGRVLEVEAGPRQALLSFIADGSASCRRRPVGTRPSV